MAPCESSGPQRHRGAYAARHERGAPLARTRPTVLLFDLFIEVEGATHELGPGSGVELPSGTAHQARNKGTDDVRFLVISSPPHQGDRREAESDNA
jgi:glyoxylate utilization-related uncharacterized protein